MIHPGASRLGVLLRRRTASLPPFVSGSVAKGKVIAAVGVEGSCVLGAGACRALPASVLPAVQVAEVPGLEKESHTVWPEAFELVLVYRLPMCCIRWPSS
jgi:hypothetical protein